ncbi:MAG: S-methyl-5'-thioadenosine phosphorylase [Proteobacteria bacterium]|nr:S-methyl-5'-thioadenosine phosphorylase [Pseudomonadota bacterium]
MVADTVIGIIGGSGVYDIQGLQNTQWTKVESPFGAPSDEFLVGEFRGQKIVFLPRHGRGHVVSPSYINYRANIDGIKRLGVTDLVSVSAVGSLREDLAPGMFVIVDQFIDRTFTREKSFFGNGLVAHVSVAHPVCSRLGGHIESALKSAEIKYVRGGTYLVMEGPQFSTLSESKLYRQWGCDVIGMTNMPEAKLAREAEICYASIAMVTDFDCWHPDHEDVSVEQVIQVLVGNAEKAKTLISEVAPLIMADEMGPSCNCKQALEFALITPPNARDPKVVETLDAIAGRVLKK